MYTDFHLHCAFSGDSDTPPEEVARSAEEKGLSVICFTDHLDMDYPYDDVSFDLDRDAYIAAIRALGDAFHGRPHIRLGVELGLQPHLQKEYAAWLDGASFDFVIGSTHLVDGQDPYYPEFWAERDQKSALRRWFEVTYDNILAFDDFDVYGHLDYILRYLNTEDALSYFNEYSDQVDEILRLLIGRGKGLEINTGGLRTALHMTNPCPDILRRYRELGGEIVTTGSDAHTADCVGFGIAQSCDILRECGFRYYTVFRGRQPEFVKL